MRREHLRAAVFFLAGCVFTSYLIATLGIGTPDFIGFRIAAPVLIASLLALLAVSWLGARALDRIEEERRACSGEPPGREPDCDEARQVGRGDSEHQPLPRNHDQDGPSPDQGPSQSPARPPAFGVDGPTVPPHGCPTSFRTTSPDRGAEEAPT